MSRPSTDSLRAPAPSSRRGLTSDRRHETRYLLIVSLTAKNDNLLYARGSGNLSTAGIFIASHSLLPIGTRVLLTVTVASTETLIVVKGTVEWLRTADDVTTAAPLPGIGVRFGELDAAATDALVAFSRTKKVELFE